MQVLEDSFLILFFDANPGYRRLKIGGMFRCNFHPGQPARQAFRKFVSVLNRSIDNRNGRRLQTDFVCFSPAFGVVHFPPLAW